MRDTGVPASGRCSITALGAFCAGLWLIAGEAGAAECVAALAYPVPGPADDTWRFCALGLDGASNWIPREVIAARVEETDSTTVFLEVGAPAPAETPRAWADGASEAIASLVPAFGPFPDVDQNGRLWVLLFAIGGDAGPLGYADPTGSMNAADILFFDVGVGYPTYSTAHELSHFILGSFDPYEEAWIYEGTGQYGTAYVTPKGPTLTGRHIEALATDPDETLVWTDYGDLADLERAYRLYEVAYLFVAYVADQLGGPALIGNLMRDGKSLVPSENHHLQGIAGVERLLAEHDAAMGFEAFFLNWSVANLLNDPALADGRFGYSSFPDRLAPRPLLATATEDEVSPWAADSFRLASSSSEAVEVSLTASPSARLRLLGIVYQAGSPDAFILRETETSGGLARVLLPAAGAGIERFVLVAAFGGPSKTPYALAVDGAIRAGDGSPVEANDASDGPGVGCHCSSASTAPDPARPANLLVLSLCLFLGRPRNFRRLPTGAGTVRK